MTFHCSETSKELQELIAKAKDYVMTPQEKLEQKVSFVYGQMGHKSGITKEQVRANILKNQGYVIPFPKHNSLSLDHNPHKLYSHFSVEEYANTFESEWISDEEKEKSIKADDFWILYYEIADDEEPISLSASNPYILLEKAQENGAS